MISANSVVCLSQVLKAELEDRGVPPQKITVIPNSVDSSLLSLELDQEVLRSDLGISAGIWIGSVTSVVPYEGLDTLIRSLAHLPDHVKVLIVGEGSQLPALKKLAHELDVDERVLFQGRVPASEVARWYKALDVFVLPRKDLEVCRTVTPLKAMEAMALAVPVVASELPAVREVTGGRCIYFRPDSPEELAEAVMRALSNAGLGGRGRNWAKQRTWEAAGQAYVDVCKKLQKELS